MRPASGLPLGLILSAIVGVSGPACADPGTIAAPPRPPSAADKNRPATPPDNRKSRLQDMRLPADAILVVCEQLADALGMVPDAIVLTPRKYQELLDEIARLREQLASRKGSPPSRCQLRGRFEGNLALLQAQFDLVTERPNTLIYLACSQGVATAAALDGHTPLLRSDADGFTLQVERPGEHQLTLDLTVPLEPRPGGQGLELSLPRAAVMSIDLDLPVAARDVRLGGRPISETLLTLKNGHLSGGLSAAERRLEVAWKDARPAAGTPLLSADGRIVVSVEATALTTDAELTLRAERGQTALWQLLVPRTAQVHVSREDEARLAGPIQITEQPSGSLCTLRLHEPGADPLKVHVSVRSSALRPGARASVGPFAVLDGARTAGIVLVRNSVPQLHLDFRSRAPLRRQWPLSDEDRRAAADVVALFRFGGATEPDDVPQASHSRWLGPWLDLEAESVRGQVKVEVSHLLELVPEENGGLAWHSTTTILATPRWAEVEELKVLLPAGWERLDEPGQPEPATPPERSTMLKLVQPSGEGPMRPVKLVLQGRYVQPFQNQGQARLGLPRPHGAVDQGGEITLRVERGLELIAPASAPAGLDSLKQTLQEQTWRCRTTPEGVSVGWRPHIPDIRWQSVADIDLTPGGGAVWRQELSLRTPEGAPDVLRLHVPPGVHGLRVQGGTLRDQGGPSQRVLLQRPTGVDHRLVLHYSFSLARGARPGGLESFHVPLVYPEDVGEGEAHVRLWCPSGPWPALIEGSAWKEQSIEEVPERTALPNLVAAALRPDAPLLLRWHQGQARQNLLAERALIRVQIHESGAQSYVARYRLRQMAATALEVELPALVSLLDLHVTLDRHEVTPEVVESTAPATAGRVVRLRLSPELVSPSSVLELSYQQPPGQATSTAWPGGLLTAELLPPLLRGEAPAVPVCWQVSVPASWVVLGPESWPGAQREWTWRGRLPALRLQPATTALEVGERDSRPPPDVLCWRSPSQGLRVLCVPQQTWLLACSLTVLVLGVLLATRTGRGWNWLRGFLGLVLLAALILSALFRPGILGALLYGCQPGLLVLGGLLLVQWLLRERSRRRIYYLRSFTRKPTDRAPAASSHAPGLPGEPSTVDHAPRKAGSSAAQRV